MKAMPVIDALKNTKQDRTPVWLMRQAGRYLPEYRALREKAGSFLTMCYTPEFATEVTLQPMRRFGLDAAIIFSDILVIPHALGQNVYFVEGEGPKLDPVDFSKLFFNKTTLDPVYEAIKRVRKELPTDKALLGFAGGPFTLASYMIEGGGGHDFSNIKKMIRDDKIGFTALIDVLSDAVLTHLQAQIEAGVDAVQIFESHAGQLQGPDFAEFIVRPVRKIVQGLSKKVPVIGFAREAAEEDFLRFAVDTGIDCVGVDQGMDIEFAARNLPPRIVIQGNLDPQKLRSGNMEESIVRIKKAMKDRAFVFNLGHGVIKDTPPEHVGRLVELVHAA